MREPLRFEIARHPDTAGFADAGKVVAAEVDEHHVLGAVLLGGEQPLGVALARLRRPRDRVQARRPVLALDQSLRRGADQREILELEQEEVRRGVDAAERTVELDRRRRRRPLGALREDDLEGVAGADQLLDPPHAGLVRGLIRLAPHLGAGARLCVPVTQSPSRAGSRSRPGRRRGPRPCRCRGRSGRACRRRRTGSPAARVRRPGAGPSVRASPRGRRRGSRRPARRGSPPPRT